MAMRSLRHFFRFTMAAAFAVYSVAAAAGEQPMEYDLVFTVEKVEEAAGYLRCLVSKKAAGFDIEFFISVKPLYGASIGENAKPGCAFIAEGVVLESSGEKSDALIGYLNEAWNCRVAGKFRKDPIRVMQTPLNYEDADLTKDYLHSKVFLEDEKRELYAELYVDFDLPNRQISFSDKDPEFSEDIIRFISDGD